MVRLKASRRALPALLFLALPCAAPDLLAAAGPATSRKAQMEFGVDMAKRGLWSEALFRFENARKLQPNDASVLNNLAICYEAAGRFDEALETYRKALEADPGSRPIKSNYSRFAEFYQDFRLGKQAAAPEPEESPAVPAPETSPAEKPADPPAPPPAGGGR
jgi:tetratricopeptide (TPR) repeat protein